jgi:uncharacterized protein YndB with AHSA1/START domain
MKILKKILIVLVALIVILCAIGFVLPGTYRVERTVEIKAPPEKVYALIIEPRLWPKWTVWNQRDPNMKVTYSGPESGVGAKWAWESKSEGTGNMEFVRADPPKTLEYKLFFPDFNSTSTGALTLTPSAGGTKVSWTNNGAMGMKPIGGYFALMMDGMVGPDFEAGLKNLKALAEKN